MSKEKNLIKNTAILTFCSIINKGLLFIAIPFFSRWLTTEEYGSFDVISTYVSLLIPIITLASSDALFRLSLEKEKEKNNYIITAFFLCVLNLLIATIVVIIIGSLLKWNLIIPFIALMFGEIIDNYIQGYLRAIRKIDLYAIGKTIITMLIIVLVTLFVFVFKMGLMGITLGYALGYLCGDIFILGYTNFWKYCNLNNIKKKNLKEMIIYSLPLIPNNISWWIVNVSDRLIINFYLGVAFNGVYAIAYKIPNLCSAIFGVFNISWQEAAIDALNDKDKDLFYNKVYNQLLELLLTVCIGILSCSYILFNYIFDIKYIDARLYAPFLVLAVVITSLSTFFGGIQISLKQPGKNGISTIIGAIVNILVNLLLIKKIGLYAACLSTVIADYVVYIIRKKQLRNNVNIRITNKNYICILIFALYSIMCYVNINLFLSLIMMFGAGTIFLIVNKTIIKKFINKFFNKYKKLLDKRRKKDVK